MNYRPAIQVMPKVALLPPELNMAEPLYQLIKDNFLHLSPFLDFIKEDMTIEDEQAYLKMMIQHHAEDRARLFMIYYEQILIGTIDLHKIDQTNRKAEVGYWIAKGYTGKQIVTKCVEHLCHYAFEILSLNKLTILADVDNIASNKVAEKAGFTFIATDYEDMFNGEQYRDMNRYALLKKDFLKAL
ncbi:GNAT family N-acetyltransferase [Staphylococcus edaphicus]|uniref:GNAT family N-acetyltransferase n=1 Tax=Staphylococcus edaphicus TaxID=1955013 RepID=A0A2C6WKR6_9STAP|nr:GNAT family protein [Staphylococcus edaphicus]PHK49690.1 GNAT family N-acetyltransferase [Staphylococcus edaphicus]UQW81889.1 GNAT family N-acetyltransferase [Staphylococcus edaphicus]